MYWLWYILIGLVAGWLGGLIVKGSGSGLILNLVIGVIGSVLGGWLFGKLGIAGSGAISIWSLITAVVGAIILLLIVSLFTKGSTKKSK